MRPLTMICAAAAAVGAGLFFPQSANALSTGAGASIAAQDLNAAEAVHCRRYRHAHRFGHRWGRGCRGGVVIISPGYTYRYVIRDGRRVRVRVRVGSSDRGVSTRERTTVRSRSTTSGEGSVSTKSTTKGEVRSTTKGDGSVGMKGKGSGDGGGQGGAPKSGQKGSSDGGGAQKGTQQK